MTPASPRIATLDLIRGVAVMGILAANIAAFHPSRWPREMRHQRLHFLYFTLPA